MSIIPIKACVLENVETGTYIEANRLQYLPNLGNQIRSIKLLNRKIISDAFAFNLQ